MKKNKKCTKKVNAKRFSVYVPVEVFDSVEKIRKKVTRSRNFTIVLALRLLIQLVNEQNKNFEEIVKETIGKEE